MRNILDAKVNVIATKIPHNNALLTKTIRFR